MTTMHKIALSPSASPVRTRSIWRNPVARDVDKINVRLSLARRRELRRRSLLAAAVLWSHLRGRRLAGFHFRRQHAIRPFLLDFFCPKQRLAIQLDGGRTLDRAATAGDIRDQLATRGITVLNFPSHQVLRETEAVLVAITFALSARRP